MNGTSHKAVPPAVSPAPFPTQSLGARERGHSWSPSLCPFLWHWAVGTWDQTPGPHSVAAVQRVPGRLSPGPTTIQWHQRLCHDACHGARHRVHVSVDLFGLIWTQQSHGT